MKHIGYYIALLGSLLFIYSLTIDPYTNSKAYHKAYRSIDREALGREASFEAFYTLRDQYLSGKYRFQDYGVTFVALGLFMIFIARHGWNNIYSPNSKWKIMLLGFGAALLTYAGFVGDLYLEFNRGSFPYWADTIGIPLIEMRIMLIILLYWAAINMMGLEKCYPCSSISRIGIRGVNWWYGTLAVITALITLVAIYDGFFWTVIPGLFWLYFYLSVIAGRKAAKKACSQGV